MKHAGPESLKTLSPLLEQLRRRAPLVEKRLGVYYLKSRAFLHFHEDPTGLFADVRLADDFERRPVTTRAQRAALMKRVEAHLAQLASPLPGTSRAPRARQTSKARQR